MSDPIYTVTTVPLNTKYTPRCVGWYSTLELAKGAAEANLGDLIEGGSYLYLVIEKVREGIYPCPTEKWWYKAMPDDVWESCSEPVECRNIIGWGIG